MIIHETKRRKKKCHLQARLVVSEIHQDYQSFEQSRNFEPREHERGNVSTGRVKGDERWNGDEYVVNEVDPPETIERCVPMPLATVQRPDS